MANKYTISTRNMDGWWCAVCVELCVSGFGTSEQEAMTAVQRAMRTTLAAQHKTGRKTAYPPVTPAHGGSFAHAH
jgi:hypothetical protein